MEMMEYKPWEKNEVKSIISKSNKELPILDIQLGGACNMKCVYCDTPKYGFPCSTDLESIKRLLDEGNIKWVYVCGLGEPTAKANIDHLKQILKWCKEKGIGLSTFSNMLNLDNELLDYIDNGTLNVLYKLDSFDKERMAYLYGVDKGDIILRNYQALNEVTHVKNGVTNLGASIVPTSVNFDEMEKIIDYCLETGIFPLIGQLENAGSCSKIYKDLVVDEEKLMELRNNMYTKYGIKYEMPICPATISGIHITNTNKIIVDEKTGLSCPWFWLNEPELKVIGDVQNMSYQEIVERILLYRQSKLKDVIDMEKHTELYPFGGCGGNAKTLLKEYINIPRW